MYPACMGKNANDDNEGLFEDISDKHNDDIPEEEESLRSYREALQQEWAEQNDPSNARQTVKQTKDAIRSQLPDYLANMRGLAMGALSESVKYNANKFLIEAVLATGGVGAKDTLAELLEEFEDEKKTEKKEN